MPEGDTVLRTARRLRAALAGRVLLRSDFRVPRFATADVAGSSVLDVVSRGKHLLIRCSDGTTVHSHLGMDGSWRVFDAAAAWRGGPDWQVRAVLANDRRVAVGCRLPVLDVLATAAEDSVVGHLGPDVLGDDWDPDRVVSTALAHPEREIGTVLLDQTVLAGLGNVYRVEACFLAGATPWTPVGDIADLPRLVGRAARLVRANVDRSDRVTTGLDRPGERLWIYGRAGRPCRRCGNRVLVAEQAPADAPTQARVTYWCQHCQRGPSPAPSTVRVPRRPGVPGEAGAPRGSGGGVSRGSARRGGPGRG